MHISTSGFETVLGLSCLGLFSHIKQLYALKRAQNLEFPLNPTCNKGYNEVANCLVLPPTPHKRASRPAPDL